MQSNSLYSLIFVFLASLFIGCESRFTEPSPDKRLGWEYFPLETGQYRIYEVEETIYALTDPREVSRSFFLKEIVVDSFTNQENRPTYIFHRLKKENFEQEWEFDSAWTVRKDEVKVVVVENNIPFVKLNFPVKEGLQWDGNAYNSLEEDDYRIENLDLPTNIGEIPFEQTLTVIQSENPDKIVFQDMRKEVYARGVGLIFKESIILRYCAKAECIGNEQIDTGRKYKQSIIAYGKE